MCIVAYTSGLQTPDCGLDLETAFPICWVNGAYRSVGTAATIAPRCRCSQLLSGSVVLCTWCSGQAQLSVVTLGGYSCGCPSTPRQNNKRQGAF